MDEKPLTDDARPTWETVRQAVVWAHTNALYNSLSTARAELGRAREAAAELDDQETFERLQDALDQLRPLVMRWATTMDETPAPPYLRRSPAQTT
jgi:hypothetical protein